MINILTNFAIFQCGWLAAVYWHNNLCSILVLLLALINLKLVGKSIVQISIISILIAAIGIFNDYLLLKAGIISFSGQHYILFPAWLAALWLLFVSTFSGSMAFVRNLRLTTQAIIGGIGGALSYVIGTKMGATQYSFAYIPQLLFHFVNWLFLFPILFVMYCKLIAATTKH